MTKILTFQYDNDLYEVAVNDTSITRISMYINGTSERIELEYDDLSREVRSLLVTRVKKYLQRR